VRVEPAITGRRVVGLVRGDVPEHHIRCPACRTLLDMRDLGAVLEHEETCPLTPPV
jgi:hypothetical protein